MEEYKLDCLHEACPIPLLKALKQLEKMEIGDILIMHTDHNCSIANVVEWAEKHGHHIDYIEIAEGEWEIYIEKAR
ncbi:TusA-related sulfurtransferase [Natronincola peptidivorans]|uniref:TusA-related sulfurtransferase n=1 Tax=Natronincola peptidivorans TaxID=426128 RepID=A0A1I0BUP5_9FIRM|nr:sulfurtransferase TusA family protein [Natronincola peptidivorans]SET10119.1 TusA-related sulfurtransferase [Natronincola peptidivorans]